MSKSIAAISGANGFIGKHLKRILLAKGWKVLDIPRDYLMDPVSLNGYMADVKPTHIFHLAAFGNHNGQTTEFDEILVTNVIKTLSLVSAARELPKLEAFVNVSTSSVYGNSAVTNLSEYSPLLGATPYATTKIAAEYICNSFATLGMNVFNVRPFSVYGEGEALHRFIPTVIQSIKDGKEFQLSPNAVHDWIYIEDFIDGLLKATDNAEHLRGQVLNIGTGVQYANMEVVKMLEEIMGKKAKYVVNEDIRPADTSIIWCADTTKAEELGIEAQTRLKDGLKRVVASYDNK